MNILPSQSNLESEKTSGVKVAYFSMEIMLENDIQTYAGGLGMLAGDILRSLADKEISAVGVTIAFNNGYTEQVINNDGTQQFLDAEWSKEDKLTQLPNTITLKIEGHDVKINCYTYDIIGRTGFVVPVFLLASDHFENAEFQQYYTKYLYDPNNRIRLIQEVILGIGGVKMLRELGYNNIENFHMNDGHCAFATLEILREQNYDMTKVKQQCCFTTHTPVPAGRDIFDYDTAYGVMGDMLPWNIKELAGQDHLDMPKLAWNLSKYTNAVSKKHGEVSSDMFQAKIDYITNGVHPATWTAPVTKEIFDMHIPEWRKDITKLSTDIDRIPDNMIAEMHRINKRTLIHYVNRYLDHKKDNGSRFDENLLTITFARRCVTYKRPDLIFSDLEKLLRMGLGKIQLIFAGKTHPNDGEAAAVLKKIIEYRNKYSSILSIAYLENYSPSISKILVAGSDIWLNNPVVPLEASGTSGMKAAMNGTINMSIMDGWFIEGIKLEPDSGFVIGEEPTTLYPERNDAKDADNIYKLIDQTLIPMFYQNKDQWIKKMKASIKLAATYNTERVVDEYMKKAWK